jgi:transposase InsO family protein
MCRILNISTSGFYGWLKEPGGKRGKDDEALCDQIKKAFDASRETYGSRRIRRELKKLERGCTLRRIRRLMRKLGLCPKRRRRFRSTTNSKHGFKVYENLLKRNFKVDGPDQVWVSDITYIWTAEGWLFLATVIDLFSRKVVGWSMSESLKSQIAIDALEMAIAARNPAPGLIHHSDRGVQYACGDYQKVITRAGMRPSMSRKGDCWDNSVAESFFSTLKKEMIYHVKFETREEARRNIFDFVEVFYNRQRMHSYLGYMSPVEFETAAAKAA